MDRSQIQQILGDTDPRWVTSSRVDRLENLNSVYAGERVLGEFGVPALDRCCPAATSCWRGAEDRTQQADADVDDPFATAGSIFWPWIGEHYRAGGVCVVSMNLNMADGGEGWSLALEYGIASDAVAAFERGDRTPFGNSSPFWWRTLATAGAILDSLDGVEVRHEPATTQEANKILERISRVQAVKCAPLREASKPTEAMIANCPTRFATPEIKILDPGVIVAFGDAAWPAIQGLQDGGAQWHEEGPRFYRGVISPNPAQPIDVLWLSHPTAWGTDWPEAQAALIASLVSHPLCSA